MHPPLLINKTPYLNIGYFYGADMVKFTKKHAITGNPLLTNNKNRCTSSCIIPQWKSSQYISAGQLRQPCPTAQMFVRTFSLKLTASNAKRYLWAERGKGGRVDNCATQRLARSAASFPLRF